MPRGRKEGSSSGKREIFWVCIGLDNANIIAEKIYSSKQLPEEDVNNFSEEKAADIFKNTYGFKPSKIIGPCYDVKSMTKQSVINQTQKNSTIDNNYKISSVIGPGQYNGWKGTVFEFANNLNKVLFIASERLDSNINKPLPSAMPVSKDLINFV
jgi:hypothetical protein